MNDADKTALLDSLPIPSRSTLSRVAPLGECLLGVSCAFGEGVLKDSVLADMWLNIAGANGKADARERRDELERDMTRAEVSRATELARACMSSDYQDCAL